MKKYLFIIISLIAIFDCASTSRVKTSDLEVRLFETNAIIDENQPFERNDSGMIVKGTLLEKFSFSNNKASFVIPVGVSFKYVNESKSYVFDLSKNGAEVVSEYVTYNVHEFLMFNEDHIFTAIVAEYVTFDYKGDEIIFIRNDNPVWSNSEDFDYDFYSKTFRDKIEYDILIKHSAINIDDLGNQFAAHNGYGLQLYNGESFFVFINPNKVNLLLSKITEDEDIIKNFKSMNVGRPYLSSYNNKLILPLKVLQPDNTKKDGYVELIVTNDEYENLKSILSKNNPFYILFRMGKFDDFKTNGHGIIYFSYSEKQLKNLMSSF